MVWQLGDDGVEDEGDEGVEEEVEIELDEYWAERFAVTATRRAARKQLEKAAEKAEKKAGVAERKRSAAALVVLQAAAPPAEPKACVDASTGRDATEAAGSSTGEAAPSPATQSLVSEYIDALSNLRMHD